MPYHVLTSRSGAVVVTMTWMRSASVLSGSAISAILSRQAWASSAFLLPPRPDDLSSSARALMAARSASLKPDLVVDLLAVDFVAVLMGVTLRRPRRFA